MVAHKLSLGLKLSLRGMEMASTNCSIFSAGKVPFGNFVGVTMWVYEAFDNSGKESFKAGTEWGVSFPKLPDRLIVQPRTAFFSVIKNHVEYENLADDFAKEALRHDNANYPVIARAIKQTSNANYFRIAFIATSIENSGAPDENLIGVALTMQDEANPNLFLRVDAKLLMAPAFGTARKEVPKEKITSYFRAPD